MNGEPYGTTTDGGHYSAGTVFKISTSGAKSEVYDFRGGNDGAKPVASLIAVNDELYGTTGKGGAYGLGTIFEVSPSGTESVLHSFGNGTDGNSLVQPCSTSISGWYKTCTALRISAVHTTGGRSSATASASRYAGYSAM
jgi:uncharacterized repeat protein (TIGR03803 family)